MIHKFNLLRSLGGVGPGAVLLACRNCIAKHQCESLVSIFSIKYGANLCNRAVGMRNKIAEVACAEGIYAFKTLLVKK